MTYAQFLAIFLGIPLLVLSGLAWADRRWGRRFPYTLRANSFWTLLLIHVLVAVAYTTPWDNYLVSTRVWWYDESLVAGITLGWVPLEEYTFFVLQTLMTGLWLRFLAVRMLPPPRKVRNGRRIRFWATGMAVLFWLAALVVLLSGWSAGRYLGLILIWALPPLITQLIFGADVLWRWRKLVLLTLLSAAVYLSLADSLAIDGGTWTIAPGQSFEIYLGGVLPLEEFIFFLVTNTLIVWGITLGMASESRERFAALRRMVRRAIHERSQRELGEDQVPATGKGFSTLDD